MKWLFSIGIGCGLLAVIGYVFLYNGIVSSDEAVKQASADIATAQQRKLDLIPQLIQAVEASASFEQGTQTTVAQLRSQALSAKDSFATTQTEETYAQGQEALTQFLLVVESYPTLTSTKNYRDLQVQLEGAENRITAAKLAYNEAVKSYNLRVRTIPSSLVASVHGFSIRTS